MSACLPLLSAENKSFRITSLHTDRLWDSSGHWIRSLDREEASGVRGKPLPDVCVPGELSMGKVPMMPLLAGEKKKKEKKKFSNRS